MRVARTRRMSEFQTVTSGWFFEYVSTANGLISTALITENPACFKPKVRPPQPENRSNAIGRCTFETRLDTRVDSYFDLLAARILMRASVIGKTIVEHWRMHLKCRLDSATQ